MTSPAAPEGGVPPGAPRAAKWDEGREQAHGSRMEAPHPHSVGARGRLSRGVVNNPDLAYTLRMQEPSPEDARLLIENAKREYAEERWLL
jgi:hypothetical protein